MHPACCDDPVCDLAYVEHLRGFAVSAHATPNRRAETVRIAEKDRQFARDNAAYRRLRKNGVQPNQIDGSAVLEARS